MDGVRARSRRTCWSALLLDLAELLGESTNADGGHLVGRVLGRTSVGVYSKA
jgi:hypothetical protein